MDSINDITREDISRLFSSTILLRGEEYFDEGLVKSIEPLNDTTITGTVQGNQRYNVSVSLDEEGSLLCECSCPCDFNCKHAAALLLKWLSVKQEYSPGTKGGAKPRKTLREALSGKSKEELVGLLESAIAVHPDLKPLMVLDRKDTLRRIRSLFSEVWEWNEVSDLISQLESILEGIRRNKSSWDMELAGEMGACTDIIANGTNSVQDEGELGMFLDKWSLTWGEVFSASNPSTGDRKKFVGKVIALMKEDDFRLDSAYEQAFIGMCSSASDIDIIRAGMKRMASDDPDDERYDQELYLKLYDKLGMAEEYLDLCKRYDFDRERVDKLISLGRLQEALSACEGIKSGDYRNHAEEKRAEILGLMGDGDGVRDSLLKLLKSTGDFTCFLKLKEKTPKGRWPDVLAGITADAKKKGRDELLARICYREGDLEGAHRYSKSVSDTDFLETLAKGLGRRHRAAACDIYTRLCFRYAAEGPGYPYKKSASMLKAVKELDRAAFERAKAELAEKYKRKHSLIGLIERMS
jgi:hypothetical protein